MTPARIADNPIPGKTYLSITHQRRVQEMRTNDSHIVSLSRFLQLSLIHNRIEGTTRSVEDSPIRSSDRFLERTLSLSDRITQSEDDRFLVQFRHQLEDFGSEGSADSRETEESGRFDVLDDLEESAESRGVRFVSSEISFVFWKLVSSVVRDESL